MNAPEINLPLFQVSMTTKTSFDPALAYIFAVAYQGLQAQRVMQPYRWAGEAVRAFVKVCDQIDAEDRAKAENKAEAEEAGS